MRCGVRPVYKRVDTCAAEFATQTAYMYSTYEEECEAEPTDRKKIMVLGGGPNRIGQGIEFDYCCVHAALALREDGYETIMVNCNPETVSTDYDTSRPPVLRAADAGGRARDRRQGEAGRRDRAVRRPDAAEARARPRSAPACRSSAPRPTRSTSPRTASASRSCCTSSACGSRRTAPRAPRRQALAAGARDRLPAGGAAELRARRPRDGDRARRQGPRALHARGGASVSEKSPVLLDRFLDDAIEVDVDCISDGDDVMIGGIMEHIEQAGVHSGDSACSLPPYSLPPQAAGRAAPPDRADGQGAEGRRPDERAVRDPGRGRRRPWSTCSRSTRARRAPCRSSRKATGLPLAKIAARCMAARRWRARSGVHGEVDPAVLLASRKRSSRSTSSPASTRSSARRCARPAR